MLTAIEKLALPGAYVDVGANIGNHTAFFEMFCPSSRVVVFEPLPFVFDFLMETREVNGLEFEAHRIGLSDRSGEVDTEIGPNTYTIPTRPLDELGLVDVAVVNLDIEGMEPQALAGMEATLRSSRPYLFIEAHTDEEIAAQESVIGLLGYERTGRVWNASPTYEWTCEKRRSFLDCLRRR